MKTRIIAALAAFAFLFLAYGANAQDAAPAEKVPSQAAERPATVQDLNTQEYITLLRQNVRILVRMVDSIDSSKNSAGYKFTATLETNLMAVDTVAAPKGATVYGRLASASSAGRMSGSSQLTLELTDIVVNGTAYPLLTNTYEISRR